MTRHDWLNSDDLQAMAGHLGAAWDWLRLAFEGACNEKRKRDPLPQGLSWGSVNFWLAAGDNHGECTRSWRAAAIRELAGDPHDKNLIVRDGKLLELVSVTHYDQGFPHIKNVMEAVYEFPSWLSWNGGTVRTLAREIRDTQAWDKLPLLVMALDDAGCTNKAIIDHLQGLETCPACEGSRSQCYGQAEWSCKLHYGSCTTCNGTGTIAARCPHLPGCWAIRVLAGE